MTLFSYYPSVFNRFVGEDAQKLKSDRTLAHKVLRLEEVQEMMRARFHENSRKYRDQNSGMFWKFTNASFSNASAPLA